MAVLAAATVALAVGMVAWELTGGSALSHSVVAERLGGLFGEVEEKADISEQLGASLLSRLNVRVDFVHQWLRWAQLAGYYRGRTVESFFGQGLLFFLGSLTAGVFLGKLFVWISPVMGALPFVFLRSKANDAKKQLQREIPIEVALLAMEVKSGTPVTTALQNSMGGQNIFARWLASVYGSAAGRRNPLEALDEGARDAGMKELAQLAAVLRFIGTKGVGHEVMMPLAQSMSAAYVSEVQAKIEDLDNQLLWPSALFFFLPFVAAVMVPILLPLFQSLAG